MGDLSQLARTPVSVLTGFLGSGKTTLLNAWLQHPDMGDAAVALVKQRYDNAANTARLLEFSKTMIHDS